MAFHESLRRIPAPAPREAAVELTPRKEPPGAHQGEAGTLTGKREHGH